jgi:DsbC/DsbD-like thiol-disulfide interchange protein
MMLSPDIPLTPVLRRFLVSSITIVALIASSPAGTPAGSEKNNPSVSCSVTVSPAKAKPGSTVTLKVTLTPVRGIHINMTPPVEIRLDSCDFVSATGTLQFPKPLKDGYLDASKPVTLPVTISKSRPSGKVTIRGMVVYFYCSEKDGWCSRFKQKFEAELTIAG